MGILIGDTITLRNGLTCENTYGCIASDTITINKEIDVVTTTVEPEEEGGESITTTETTTKYILRGKGVIWTTKELRDNLSPKLKFEFIELSYDDPSFLSNNVFTLLYNKWKENFTTVTDDI